jgi:hypothetical protein
MKYIIYKITNLVNKKVYIGKHQTHDIYDTYMGSGTGILLAIKKYGIRNFKKYILFIFDNERDMNTKEETIVNREFVLSKNTYNQVIGGGCSTMFKDTALMLDADGNRVRLHINDPMFKDCVGQTIGKTYAFNTITNLPEYTIKNDPRFKTGELIGNTKGKKYYNNGVKCYKLNEDDSKIHELNLIPGYIFKDNKKIISHQIGFMNCYDLELNKNVKIPKEEFHKYKTTRYLTFNSTYYKEILKNNTQSQK